MSKRKPLDEIPELKVLRGWRQIGQALGLACSPQTVRRICREFHAPIFMLRNKPTIDENFLVRWWLLFEQKVLGYQKVSTDVTKKHRKGQGAIAEMGKRKCTKKA